MELDLHGQINKRKGWQKVILLTIQGYFDNKVGRNAAAVTYYLLFAMFPFFIFVTSLLGLLHLPTLTLDGQITRFLPEDVVAFLNLAIEHITKSSNNALLTFGLVFSVWFPLRAVSNLMEAINDIYGEEKSGSHSIRTAILTALTLCSFLPCCCFCCWGKGCWDLLGNISPFLRNSSPDGAVCVLYPWRQRCCSCYRRCISSRLLKYRKCGIYCREPSFPWVYGCFFP